MKRDNSPNQPDSSHFHKVCTLSLSRHPARGPIWNEICHFEPTNCSNGRTSFLFGFRFFNPKTVLPTTADSSEISVARNHPELRAARQSVRSALTSSTHLTPTERLFFPSIMPVQGDRPPLTYSVIIDVDTAFQEWELNYQVRTTRLRNRFHFGTPVERHPTSNDHLYIKGLQYSQTSKPHKQLRSPRLCN